MLLRRIRSGWVSNSLFEVLHPVTTRMTFFLLGVSSSALPSCVSQALPALDGHEAILRGLSCIVQKGERAMLFVKELGYRAPELMNVMSVLFVCLSCLCLVKRSDGGPINRHVHWEMSSIKAVP